MAGFSIVMAVAWVLVLGVTWTLASPLAPVPTALESPSAAHHTAAGDPLEAPQEKRLLKYLIPSGGSWMPTQMEGSKRGYNKNYLRFGRSEEDKRDGRNFLRFGRGGEDIDMDDLENFPETEDSVEKRNRNFLRFGRDRNFLRFGRSDAEDFGLPGGPLAFANGMQDEDLLEDIPLDEKRAGHRNYLRFGRGGIKNRFGRAGNRNFIRFGRSVDRQLKEEKTRDTTLNPTAAPHSPAKTQESHRSKRSASPYNQIMMPSRGPVAWGIDYQPEEEEELDESLDAPEVTKRAYNKSFLRFGRDRNFLRFGKRNDAPTEFEMEPPTYPRFQRAPYVVRFG
ncbi:FMRF-amide neuropeptides-like [Eriocheir sinensis]|uniref:FMRF-amide neuropeptides-like n=1 Tax=Eriocheir sinensis TaxID=95602 RepID=UPI0021C6826D|nr:FMRF-amide neuropeptides-like [Eriocheir sinensis]